MAPHPDELEYETGKLSEPFKRLESRICIQSPNTACTNNKGTCRCHDNAVQRPELLHVLLVITYSCQKVSISAVHDFTALESEKSHFLEVIGTIGMGQTRRLRWSYSLICGTGGNGNIDWFCELENLRWGTIRRESDSACHYITCQYKNSIDGL